MSRSAARGEWDPAVSSSPYTSKSDVTVHDNRDHLVLDPTRNEPYTLNHSVGTSLILHSEGNQVRDPRMGILACEVNTIGQMADSRVSNCAEFFTAGRRRQHPLTHASLLFGLGAEGTFFQSHFIAVSIRQCVFDANLLVQFVCPLDRDFCFLRYTRVRRLNNPFDSS